MASATPGDQGGYWGRRDWLVAGALFLLTFISRLPFRTTLYYAWDSVLYAKALEKFDVTIYQPQPPGHIFYVALVKLVNMVVGDPNSAMIWVSITASAAAVAMLYRLGLLMYGRTTGLLAALFLATSLSYWGHGEVALPYTLLAFLSPFTATAIYGAWQGRDGQALSASLRLGIASGFRQDLLLFLLPLWAVDLFGKRKRTKLTSVALMAAVVAAWYIPSALLSGGFAAYRHASSEQSSYLLRTASVFYQGLPGLGFNLHSLVKFTLYATVAATPFLAYYLARLVFGSRVYARQDRRLLFLGVWIIPSLLFYVFIHIGEYGYVFFFLPAVLVMAAQGVIVLAKDLAGIASFKRRRKVLVPALAVPAIALNLALFLVLAPHLSADRLAANDAIQRSRIETVRKHFDPASTLVISAYNYQQAQLYLPEYRHWYIDPVTAVYPIAPIPPGVEKVVIFEESLSPARGSNASEFPLARERRLYYFELAGERSVVVDWQAAKVSLSDTTLGIPNYWKSRL